jgi:7,8-dihydro-6-hydroxymethylpterin-pyrophosphokinase
VAKGVLKTLDKPRNRGGRKIVARTADGDLILYRDNAKQRVCIEHPRCGSLSLRINVRGVYISSGANIQEMAKFLEENPLTLTYLAALQ